MIRFFTVVLALGWWLAQPAFSADAPPRNIVFVSWDGMGRDVLRELLAAKKLPAIAGVIADGSLQEINVTGHATSTMPGHATLLTGHRPKVHGIRHNGYPRPIPAGLTVFEQLEKHFGNDGIRTMMVAGKSVNLGCASTNDVYGLAAASMDVCDSDDRPAASVVKIALPLLERNLKSRFFLFLHFRDVDSAGHSHGKDSPEYRAAAVESDQALGEVMQWLASHQLTGNTRVYVVADHGFDDHGQTHDNAPEVFLATNDKAVVRGGVQADVAATILERFGVDLAKLQPPLAGRPLTAKPAARPSRP